VEKDAPRMLVKGFRITGVNESRDAGITQQAVEQLVKTAAEQMVASVASDGFTISMFETITSTVARFYRQRGYFLARAYIPEQTITDGIVQINIVEGFLDQVIYSGNSLYSDEQLGEVFEPLIGRSVFKPRIDDVLFALNNYPGLSSSMVFGPGLKPGSAAIQLNSSEVSSRANFSLDNFGSVYTGENRWRVNYVSNNTFGQADLLDLNLIITSNPQNSLYWDASYQQPVFDFRFLAGGGIQLNNFDVGGNLQDLDINGESSDIFGFMQYIYRRNRVEKLSTTAELHLKSATSSAVSTSFTEDQIMVINLAADYAGTSWSSSGAFQSANITLGLGFGESTRTSPSFAVDNRDFTKISYRYSRIQPLTPLSNLLFTFRGQSSSDQLTSLEQFSLGGPDTVRAYPVAEALMDSANLFSIEWMAFASPDIQQTWLNKLQMSVFYDIAQGSLNNPLRNETESVSLSGFGGSIQVEPFNEIRVKVTLAFDMGDEPSDNMTLPFYFSLNYGF
jgi:hemolysin activation/secretion protein